MSADAPTPLVECRQVVKQYPGVLALDRVDFQLLPGEVHVLFGENGAGKSTLISLLAGAQERTAGEILVRGRPCTLHSVHRARELGISAVFQEFSLVPQLSVEQNLFLGAEPRRHGFLDRQALRREAKRMLDRLGFMLDPSERVQHLTRAQQQMVEIAKAFRTQPSVLILDEPTASLDRARDRAAVRADPGRHRAWCGRDLHHPSHERDPPHRRSRHGAARRPCDRTPWMPRPPPKIAWWS